MPALRTAQEMAFTAVHIEFSSVVSSPVPFAFLPCSITNRVTVTTLVSKPPPSDMVADGLPKPESGSAEETLQDLNAQQRGTRRRGVRTRRANPELQERCGPAGSTTRFVQTEPGGDEMIMFPIEGCDQKNSRRACLNSNGRCARKVVNFSAGLKTTV